MRQAIHAAAHAASAALARPALLSVLLSIALSSAPDQARGDLSIPRLLFPGTYSEYCGPTPEVGSAGGGECTAHGWHGDAPIDIVDETCRAHDIAYCGCESELGGRRSTAAASLPRGVLPGLTALRSFNAAASALSVLGADEAYFQCAHCADAALIREGLRVRSLAQRDRCAAGRYAEPAFFCELRGEVLARVERVDFDFFLSDLDRYARRADAQAGPQAQRPSLSHPLLQLEAERRSRLALEATRVLLPAAAAVALEAEMQSRLGAVAVPR
mmetsp:Transcript_34826/g.86806  ORF Transcript_34826/g.86806 Transcript_34826/m.86806 type:complete len:272 (-) Transcript_34826:54-869(-)